MGTIVSSAAYIIKDTNIDALYPYLNLNLNLNLNLSLNLNLNTAVLQSLKVKEEDG